ncbi:UPF0489 protein C5orf22 homolog [Bactrocera neohumeralis]|uniref:UPF0489 protein C5orf22 homolog n=1 Tax=Bactrocera neohumeralis TaxID=98809 RepID=UPI00216597F1|nr:UPF0489 protein C5orf22 homolog [Bactrocera neohumeralis]
MEGDSNVHSGSSTVEISPKGVIEASDGLVESSSALSESVSAKNIDTVYAPKERTESEAGTEEQPPTKRPKSDLDEESGLGNVSTTSIAGTVSDRIALKPKDFTLDTEEFKNAQPRKFQRIPIFIADYHNDVLEFIYRCLATRHLPLENNILIHFDSHPDMVISREIPASASYDKETMLAELSIENWIMPACYAGHFNRVIWLKNSWCQQIPLGKYNFKIGHKNDKISVDCPLDYFISEGNYCDTKELLDTRNMELQVINVDTSSSSAPIDTAQFIKEADGPNFVLDIDLDFFSTSNPFLEIYKDANCYEQLSDIFHFEPEVKDCGGTTERRKLQLEALKKIFEHLEETRTLDGLTPAPDPNIIAPETYARIENLAKSLQKHYADDEIDWLLIYDSGSTTDTNGLPHHISTSKELEQYIGQFKCLLQNLPTPPVLITMACSAEDDYCPKHQVGVIQERVLEVLREVFGNRLHDKPILHYLDEEWDVMQL